MGGTAFLQKKIKQLAVEKINEQVTVPVKVQGGISLSLFRHFPYASITLSSVTIPDKLRPGKNLLQLEEVSLLMNVWTLLSDQQEVTRIFVGNGNVDVYVNKDGAANYDILRPDHQNPNAKFKILLKEAIAREVDFGYYNAGKNEIILAHLANLNLEGNFSEKQFDLKTKADAMVKLIQVNQEKYLEKKSVEADMTLHVDQQQQRFSVQQAKLELEHNEFVLHGYWVAARTRTEVNFEAESKGDDVANFLALIPDQFNSTLAGASGSGQYTIKAVVKGSIQKEVNPEIIVSASLHDAHIQFPKLSRKLESVQAEGYYKMNSRGADELHISRFESTFRNEPFSLMLDLQPLRAPQFDVTANGTIDVEEVRSFFSDTLLENAEGKIDLQRVHVSGKIADWNHLETATVHGDGGLLLRDVEFQTDGVTYGNIQGKVQFDDARVKVSDLSLNFLNTDIVFNGEIDNALNYGLGLAGKRADDNTLGLQGKLQLKRCNLSNMIEAFDKKKAKKAAAGEKMDIRNIFNMSGNVSLTIDQLSYNKMNFNQVAGEVMLEPHQIIIERISSHAMGGDINTRGTIGFTPWREMLLNLDLVISKVELPQLFAQSDNFGQSTLTDKNLKGSIAATAQFKTVWKNYKDIDLDRLEGELQCSIHQGELLNFEPLKAASRFIKVEELNDITFSELSNTLFIRNGVISVPQMEVNSSALNLMLNGTHTLENVIDYHIKINLKKLLAAKFSRSNPAAQYVEEDPYEGTNLFLTLSGPLSAPTIKYDKKAVNNRIKQEFSDEREELKQLLKKGNQPEKPVKDRTREDKYFDTKQQPVFMDLEEEKKE